jgi:hypothetical protein
LNTDDVNARHSNETEGIAWMLFRDSANNNDDVQVFRGRRTQNQVADTNALFTFGVTHQLKITIDTNSDGSSFTADFFVDNVSVLASPLVVTSLSNPGGGATVPGTLLNQIRYVGFSYDDATANPPRVDNFLFTVPEPAVVTLVFIGLCGVAMRRRIVR